MRPPRTPTLRASIRVRAAAAMVLIALGTIVLFTQRPGRAAEPAYSFQNPFHPQQCQHAIQFAKQRLARDPSSTKWRLVLAEGWLCRGLGDDPWALDTATRMLRHVVAEQPSNFFAQLELADALRKRFPASEEAETLLRNVYHNLDAAPGGTERDDLSAYVRENLAAVAQQRVAVRSQLAQNVGAFPSASTSADELGAYVSRLMQTGPDGLHSAEQAIFGFLASHPADPLATLYLAEARRGRAKRAECRELYGQVQQQLCAPERTIRQGQECALAQWRIEQLDSKPDP